MLPRFGKLDRIGGAKNIKILHVYSHVIVFAPLIPNRLLPTSVVNVERSTAVDTFHSIPPKEAGFLARCPESFEFVIRDQRIRIKSVNRGMECVAVHSLHLHDRNVLSEKGSALKSKRGDTHIP